MFTGGGGGCDRNEIRFFARCCCIVAFSTFGYLITVTADTSNNGSVGSNGLKLTQVRIPRHMDVREAAVLSCEFELGDNKLYSVKWYKDEFEFFRFMPDNSPPIQMFPLNGVNLDLSRSNMTAITLKPVHLNSSGTYRCEVSTDGPNFETVVRNGNMTVMVFPNDDPTIEGIQEWYNVGEYISGNCTSAQSYPVAELSWFINGDRAKSWLLQKYPTKKTILSNNDDPSSPRETYTQTLGLRFQVDKTHFAVGDRLVLKCTAKIGDLPHWQRVLIVHPSYSRYAAAAAATADTTRVDANVYKPVSPDRYRNVDGGASNLGWNSSYRYLVNLCVLSALFTQRSRFAC